MRRETDVHASLQQDKAAEVEKIRTQRTAAVKRLEAKRAAEEAAEAAAAAAAEEPQRSDMWTNRRNGAALLTAAARRKLVHSHFTRPDGVWETERTRRRAAGTLVAAARRSERQRLQALQSAAAKRIFRCVQRVALSRRHKAHCRAVACLEAALQRKQASDVLEQMRYMARALGSTLLASALHRFARRSAFETLALRSRACRTVLGPRLGAAVQRVKLEALVAARQCLVSATQRALQQLSAGHRAMCEQLQAQRVLRDVAARQAAERRLQQRRAAADEVARLIGAAQARRRWQAQRHAAAQLQACMRCRLDADKASFQMGEAAMERCSLRERRRKKAQAVPSWKQPEVVSAQDAPHSSTCHVSFIWLPCFAADHVDDASAGDAGDMASSGGTAWSSRGTSQAEFRVPPHATESDAAAAEEEEEEEEEYEQEMKLCMGASIKIARPLSSHVRQCAPGAADASARPGSVRASRASGRPRTGAPPADTLARPMTSGGSRNADTSADAEQIVKRWAASAENISLIDDDDLAAAAVRNIIINQGTWVSEGMKCWLAHCIARRSARSSADSSRAAPRVPPAAAAPGGADAAKADAANKDALRKAIGHLWPFIDEEPQSRRAGTAHANGWPHGAGGGQAVEEEPANSISVRQRVCSQLHVAYLCASVGDYAKALKLSTAARKALAPVAAYHQQLKADAARGKSEPASLPPWPSLLSCGWHGKRAQHPSPEQHAAAAKGTSGSDGEEDEEDEGLGGYVDCCPSLVLAVAQINCAASLLHMGAADQALQMALAAHATFDKAAPLVGRGRSSGVAWEAQALVGAGIQQVLAAAQAANGVEVKASEHARTDVLELTHDSDDEVPIACATTMGTALFAKQPANPHAMVDDDFETASPFSGLTPQRRMGGVFSTQPLGRLGAFAGDSSGAGLLTGSARLSSSEVAEQVASLLDQTGAADVGPPPPSVAPRTGGSSAAAAHRPGSSSRGGAVVAGGARVPAGTPAAKAASTSSASSASSAAAAQLIGSASSPLSDMNGGAGRARFGQNGATWRMTHGTRPISASRQKTLGFTPDVGRHAPLLAPKGVQDADDAY